MTRLGSIFPDDGDGPRGPDLYACVEVPPGALGHAAGVRVAVPRELPGGGLRHPRVDLPGDDGDTLVLHLPPDLRDGTTLRLRGRGAAGEGCRSGDLYLEIRVRPDPREGWVGLVEPPAPSAMDPTLWVVLGVGALMLVGLLAAWLAG